MACGAEKLYYFYRSHGGVEVPMVCFYFPGENRAQTLARLHAEFEHSATPLTRVVPEGELEALAAELHAMLATVAQGVRWSVELCLQHLASMGYY